MMELCCFETSINTHRLRLVVHLKRRLLLHLSLECGPDQSDEISGVGCLKRLGDMISNQSISSYLAWPQKRLLHGFEEQQRFVRGNFGTMSDVEVGPPIVKADSDERSYKLIKLRNGLAALLIHDPEVSLDEEAEDDDDTDDMEIDVGCPSQQPEDQEWSSDFQNNCVGGIDLNVDTRPRLRFHPVNEVMLTRDHDEGDEEGNTKSSIFSSLKKDKEFDPSSTKKAAAAMCVGVGSMADPEDSPGLAHFLEHMLFMGSTKFPDENEYDKFLSQHGGSSNAYTDQEFTCYHFEVINKCFRDALERFSQFFISPLVKVEAMDREIQAIESEFMQALANDGNRLSQVQCHTALPSHPMHRFSWGNRKSLGEPMERGVDMRGKLLQLYHDHYRAGRMKLVLLGGESIETLQKWVVELFSGVREGGHGRLTFHCEGRIWEPHRFYLIAAGQEQSLVSLTWPLPCLESAYLKKPQDYFGHLIGHEGAGSLQALLKKRGWGRTVMAGCGDNGHETNSVTFNFTVTISLTSHGLQHVMEVIGLLYQYLKMLRSVGPQEWVFKEQKAVSTLNFQFPEEGASDEYAISLATNMHLYSEAHIMYGEYAHDVWDPSLITSLLARLTPENMRLDLLLHSFDKNVPGVQIEPWFETPFKEETLPANTLKIWANPPSVDPALHMPVHNEFIPHDFTIHTTGKEHAHPSCLLDSAALKVWHKIDTKFSTPRTNAFLSITLSAGTKSVEDAVLAQLYVVQLKSELNKMLYLANMAKLETSITLSGYKLEVKLSGFSEKLPVLAERIVANLKGIFVTSGNFESLKECMFEDYKRANENPIDHASYISTQALSKRFWNIESRSACLARLTFADYVHFFANLFNKTYIECFFHGNILKKQALHIAKVYEGALVNSPLPLEKRPTNCVLKFPAGTSLLYKENCKTSCEKNSVARLYFQIGQDLGKDTRRLRCLLDLFETVISEPFFNQLRTQEQLGYTVDSGCQDLHKVLGFTFMVQSAKYSPAYLQARTNVFIEQIPAILTKMTEEQFKDHKDALIAQKLEPPYSLYEETEQHWEQIWERRYLYDECKKQAQELETLTKNELINWCRRFIGVRSRNRRHLCIHIIGLNAQEGHVDDPKVESSHAGGTDVPRRTLVIDNLEEFKKHLESYRVVF